MFNEDFDTDLFVQAIPLATLIIGPDKRVLVLNDLAKKMLGHESVGRHYITALRQPALIEAIESVFRDSEQQIAWHNGLEHDQIYNFKVTLAPLRIQTNLCVMMTFEDQTV